MSNPVKMMLCIEAGKSKGKKITLKKGEYTIGSSRKSAIRLQGEFVSPEHAILKLRDEGQWVLQNRSSNQTLVNDQIIDTKPLVVGDSIQVGASNLLKFDVVPTKSSGVKKSANGRSEFANVVGEYLKKPVVVVALTFYLIIIFLVFSFLGSRGENLGNANWSSAKIDTVVKLSSDYLLERSNFITASAEIVGDDQSTVPALTTEQIFKAAKKLDGYDSIVWLHRSVVDDQESPLPEVVSSLMLKVQERLRQIWHFEQQERWADVIAGYDEVSAMVPDIKLPITQKIIERQRWAIKKEKAQR